MTRALLLGALLLGAGAVLAEQHYHTGCVCTGNYGTCGRQSDDGAPAEGVIRDCKCSCGHGGRWCR